MPASSYAQAIPSVKDVTGIDINENIKELLESIELHSQPDVGQTRGDGSGLDRVSSERSGARICADRCGAVQESEGTPHPWCMYRHNAHEKWARYTE